MIDGLLGIMQANQVCKREEGYREVREKFQPLRHKPCSSLLFTNMSLALEITHRMLLIHSFRQLTSV